MTKFQSARRIGALTVVFVWLIAGCSYFSWVPFIGDKTPKVKVDKPVPLAPIQAEAEIEILWRKGIGRGLGNKFVSIVPAIVADRVVSADAYGSVAAFDRFEGTQIWRTSIGKPAKKKFLDLMDRSDKSFVAGGVGQGDGMVFFGTTGGEVVALNAADGAERWRVRMSSEVLAPPVADRGVVLVQTSDGKLYALESDTGEQRWVYNSQVPIVSLRGTATPVLRSGIAFTGFANGTVTAVDVRSGAQLWEQRISLPEGTSELDRMVDVDGSPLVTNQLVLASSHQGKTRAMRQADGGVIWETNDASFHALGSGYGLIYVVTDDDQIVALDEQQATEVWRQEGLLRRSLTNPLVFSNYVVVADSEGYLHVLAQSDGRFIARKKVAGNRISASMVQSDGTVYLQSQSGQLIALEIKRG